MNDERRAELARARTLLDDAKRIIETCAFDEREYYDSVLDDAEREEEAEEVNEAADALDDAVDGIDTLLVTIEGAEA